MADQRRKQNHPPGVRNVKKQKRPVRKSKKRRRLRAGIFFTVAIAAGIFLLLSLTVLFRISVVETAPSEHYTAEQIIEAAGIPTGTNLFRADRGGAAKKICQALPYIENASVSIALPDKISISVTEAQPAFQLEQDGSYYLLSKSLKVLEQAGQPASGLPVIAGTGLTDPHPGQTAHFEREELQTTLLSLCQQLEANQFSDVTAIDISKLYSVELRCGENLTIRLGSTSNLEEKLQIARYVIDNKLDSSKPGTLDLSQENGQAIFRPQYGSSAVIIPPTASAASSE